MGVVHGARIGRKWKSEIRKFCLPPPRPALNCRRTALDTSDHAQQSQPKDHGIERRPAESPLESAARYIARGPGASAAGDGGGEAFSASISALLDWGLENKLIRPEEDFPFFNRSPDGHGDEHEAWFNQDANRWFKATYPDRFGLAWGRDGSATVYEYLQRLILQNAYFGDDIRLEALVNCRGRLRVLTSQPHIAGDPAEYREIEKWFLEAGFLRFEHSSRVAWYLKQVNLLVADAHEGNVIRSVSGRLIPIDLNIVKPAGALLEWARAETRAKHANPDY
jgi:hypothetical protein